MSNSFHFLFSIDVFHEYFFGGICKGLIFKPNKETGFLIKKYGFVINNKTNGFDFYSSSIGSSIDYLNHITTYNQQDYFESIATQWRYYIVNNSKTPLINPIIVGEIPVDFEVVSNVTLPNGQKATLFSSGKNLLKLSETAIYKFDLFAKSKSYKYEF